MSGSEAVRSREQLLVELSSRLAHSAILADDVNNCMTFPMKTLEICKSRLAEAVIAQTADMQQLQALRRDVKRSEKNVANARIRDLPEAIAAVAFNTARIEAIKTLLTDESMSAMAPASDYTPLY